jgi:hypothetical protein
MSWSPRRPCDVVMVLVARQQREQRLHLAPIWNADQAVGRSGYNRETNTSFIYVLESEARSGTQMPEPSTAQDSVPPPCEPSWFSAKKRCIELSVFYSRCSILGVPSEAVGNSCSRKMQERMGHASSELHVFGSPIVERS